MRLPSAKSIDSLLNAYNVNGQTTTASYTLDDLLEVYGDNTYYYDEDGYLTEKTTPEGTTTYVYGTLGELREVSTPTDTITYLHNANNQRVAKKINGVITEKYLWANLTTLLAVYKVNGEAREGTLGYDGNDNLLQRFEYADSRMPIAMTQDNQKYYLHYDQVGSLRAVSDVNGDLVKEVVYDTYGNILSDSNPVFKVPLGFAGGLYDTDTKLTRFGYRDYDAFTGKWTAKDPIVFGGGDTNLYGYVLGDPVNFVDPLGLYIWEFFEPTSMGPNEITYIDQKGNKTVYDFDSGKTRPYWDKKKGYCETRQQSDKNTGKPKPPNPRNANTRAQKALVFLEIIIRMFK